jgi:hypothetical protein
LAALNIATQRSGQSRGELIARRRSTCGLEGNAQPPREILDELPRDPT